VRSHPRRWRTRVTQSCALIKSRALGTAPPPPPPPPKSTELRISRVHLAISRVHVGADLAQTSRRPSSLFWGPTAVLGPEGSHQERAPLRAPSWAWAETTHGQGEAPGPLAPTTAPQRSSWSTCWLLLKSVSRAPMPPTSGDKCHVTWRVAWSGVVTLSLTCVACRIDASRNLVQVHGTEPLHMLQAGVRAGPQRATASHMGVSHMLRRRSAQRRVHPYGQPPIWGYATRRVTPAARYTYATRVARMWPPDTHILTAYTPETQSERINARGPVAGRSAA